MRVIVADTILHMVMPCHGAEDGVLCHERPQGLDFSHWLVLSAQHRLLPCRWDSNNHTDE